MLRVTPKDVEQKLRTEDERFQRLLSPSPDDLAPIADVIRAGFAENFASESSADGRWSPLARSTQRQRAARGYPPAHPILVRTGDYKASFVNRGSSDHVEEVDIVTTSWSLRVGSRHALARFHESTEPRTQLPRRSVLGLTPAQEERVRQRAQRFIEDALE